MPTIGELLELEQEIGAKEFQERAEAEKLEGGNKKKRENVKFQAKKGAPLEKSSKIKPKDMFLQPVNNNAHKHDDPRFSDQHGEFKQKNFDKYYEFIDDIEQSEIDQLKKHQQKLAGKRRKGAPGKTTNDHEHEIIGTIKSREQRLQARKTRRAERKLENKKRKDEVQAVREGKMPYFSKKAKSNDENKPPKKDKRKNMPDGFRRSAKSTK